MAPTSMSNPTPADRLALTLCPFRDPFLQGEHPTVPCDTACKGCRRLSHGYAQELATILDERHGGSSQVADWLRGILP